MLSPYTKIKMNLIPYLNFASKLTTQKWAQIISSKQASLSCREGSLLCFMTLQISHWVGSVVWLVCSELGMRWMRKRRRRVRKGKRSCGGSINDAPTSRVNKILICHSLSSQSSSCQVLWYNVGTLKSLLRHLISISLPLWSYCVAVAILFVIQEKILKLSMTSLLVC